MRRGRSGAGLRSPPEAAAPAPGGAQGRGAGAALPPRGAGARRRRGREAGSGAAASRPRAGCPASLSPPHRGSPARSRGCGAQSGGGRERREGCAERGRRRGRGTGQWRVAPAGSGRAASRRYPRVPRPLPNFSPHHFEKVPKLAAGPPWGPSSRVPPTCSPAARPSHLGTDLPSRQRGERVAP